MNLDAWIEEMIFARLYGLPDVSDYREDIIDLMRQAYTKGRKEERESNQAQQQGIEYAIDNRQNK